jgi:peptide/nickel transport system substrate-binding protein
MLLDLRRHGALALAMVIGITACSPAPGTSPTTGATAAPAAPAARQPSSISVCVNSDVTTLDTRVLTILNVRTILGNILDYPIQLANEGDKLVLKPHLVTSWTNRDPLTWRLQLRQGVKFHNGEAFNAEAFKFSIEAQKDRTATLKFYLGNIKEVKIVDEFTVDLITATPSPLTIPNLVQVYVYPPKYTQEAGDKFSERPIGTGPFRFVEWVKGDHVGLEANKEYWDTKTWPKGPPVDKLTFRFCPDPTTRIAMLQRGEIDLIDNVDVEQLATIKNNPNTKSYQAPGYKRIYLAIYARPGEVKPLDDVRVRKALNHAIDKQAIATSLLGGLATPYAGHTHVGLECRNTDLKPFAYDQATAKRLLTEAGYPNGFSVDLFTTTGAFPKDRDLAQAVAAQLGQVGVKVNIVPLEFADYSTRFNTGNVKGLAVARRTTNTGDPADQFRFTIWRGAGFNYVNDPKFDTMFEATETVTDLAKRCQMLKDVEAYIWNEMVPQVAIYDLTDIFGLNAKLNWIPVNRRENIDLRGLQNNP